MKRELKLCVHTISTNPKRKGLRVSAQATQTSAYLPRISRSEDLWTFCDKVNTSKPATYPRNEEVVYVIGGTLAVVECSHRLAAATVNIRKAETAETHSV